MTFFYWKLLLLIPMRCSISWALLPSAVISLFVYHISSAWSCFWLPKIIIGHIIFFWLPSTISVYFYRLFSFSMTRHTRLIILCSVIRRTTCFGDDERSVVVRWGDHHNCALLERRRRRRKRRARDRRIDHCGWRSMTSQWLIDQWRGTALRVLFTPPKIPRHDAADVSIRVRATSSRARSLVRRSVFRRKSVALIVCSSRCSRAPRICPRRFSPPVPQTTSLGAFQSNGVTEDCICRRALFVRRWFLHYVLTARNSPPLAATVPVHWSASQFACTSGKPRYYHIE